MTRRYDSVLADVLGGAAGGLVGGLAVSALLAAKTVALHEPAGELAVIRRRALDRLHRPHRRERARSDRAEEAAGHGWHLLLSVGLGAAYGLVRRRIPGPPAAAGALFGLGFLPVAYGVAGPALGLTEPLWEEAVPVQAQRTLVHALFGALTGLVTELAAERVHPFETHEQPG